MKKRTKIVITISFVLLIIILILTFKPKTSSHEFVEVKKKNLQQIVSASGTIKPNQKIDLQFETTGRVKNIFVKVGDQIKVGQTLIRLEDNDLQAQYQQQTASLEAAKAQLDLLKAGSSREEISLAETAVNNAQKNLNDIKEKANHDLSILYDNSIEILNDAHLKTESMYYIYIADLFTSQNKLSFSTTHSQTQIQAENYYYTVKDNLNRMTNLINQLRVLSDSEKIDLSLESFKKYLETNRIFLDFTAEALNNSVGLTSATLTTYKTNLEIARTNTNLVITNILNRQQSIASQKINNQININNAQATLDQSSRQLEIKKAGARDEDIRYREALIKQQEANLSSIIDRLRKMTLVAPIDGIITFVNSKIGETIIPNQISVSMNSVGNFEIELDIAETDITKIITGQLANIEIDAIPNEKFNGHITKINPAETIIQGVVYYKSTVGFNQVDERLRAGMTANVDVITAEKNNVLTIPLRSVTRIDGKGIIKILENNQIIEKEIEIGLLGSGNEIEVISGLIDGQQIVSFIRQK